MRTDLFRDIKVCDRFNGYGWYLKNTGQRRLCVVASNIQQTVYGTWEKRHVVCDLDAGQNSVLNTTTPWPKIEYVSALANNFPPLGESLAVDSIYYNIIMHRSCVIPERLAGALGRELDR